MPEERGSREEFCDRKELAYMCIQEGAEVIIGKEGGRGDADEARMEAVRLVAG